MKVYTVAQIADLVGVSATTVRNALQAGKLKGYKERGRYQITQVALDEWVAQRNIKEQGQRPGAEYNKNSSQVAHNEQTSLVPWEYVHTMQEKLHGAIYQAGKAEAQVQFLAGELSRLRSEKYKEQERYEARIKDLENQLRQQQENIIERMETREKAMIEFITSWRESAAALERQKKQPWWKRILGGKNT